MNDQLPRSALDAQVDAMLKRVAADREQRCSQMLAAAESQARDILHSARADARASLRKAVAQERSRLTQGLRQAEARAELDARWRAQRETQVVLQQMWAEISDALEARWRDPIHRRSWIAAALRQADLLLSARAWRIEHDASWSAAEQREIEQLIAPYGVGAIEWVGEIDLRAGIRIRCAGVCLDATTKGLLARHEDIEATFLAEYLALDDVTAAADTRMMRHELPAASAEPLAHE